MRGPDPRRAVARDPRKVHRERHPSRTKDAGPGLGPAPRGARASPERNAAGTAKPGAMPSPAAADGLEPGRGPHAWPRRATRATQDAGARRGREVGAPAGGPARLTCPHRAARGPATVTVALLRACRTHERPALAGGRPSGGRVRACGGCLRRGRATGRSQQRGGEREPGSAVAGARRAAPGPGAPGHVVRRAGLVRQGPCRAARAARCVGGMHVGRARPQRMPCTTPSRRGAGPLPAMRQVAPRARATCSSRAPMPRARGAHSSSALACGASRERTAPTVGAGRGGPHAPRWPAALDAMGRRLLGGCRRASRAARPPAVRAEASSGPTCGPPQRLGGRRRFLFRQARAALPPAVSRPSGRALGGLPARAWRPCREVLASLCGSPHALVAQW